MSNTIFIYFLVTLMVWAYRAKRALLTLYRAPRIKPLNTPSDASTDPLVTIFVPAKNEEMNIESCVQKLLAQSYKNIEIIVINDNSTDRTEALLKKMGAVCLSDAPEASGQLKYMNNRQTPEGWTGKNFALHSAIPFAKGDWFLFTDADTQHDPGCLHGCIRHVLQEKISLLTLLPKCLTGGFWENVIQPTAMCYTGLWFPLEKVNDPEDPLIFGNGQFLMISQSAYKKLGGHQNVKGAFLEDFALVELAKQKKLKAQVAMGVDVYGTRMYDSLERMRKGWRRIFLHAFKKNKLAIARSLLSVFCFSILPFILFIPATYHALQIPETYGLAWGFSISVLSMIFITMWKAHRVVKAKTFYAFVHPFAACYLVIILADVLGMSFTGKKTKWR